MSGREEEKAKALFGGKNEQLKIDNKIT